LTGGLEVVNKATFSPDGQRLALIGDGGHPYGHAYLWEANTGQPINQLHYDRQVWSLDFSADSRLWATGSVVDGKVILADAVTGQPIREFNHVLGVHDLALSPTGPWLAAMLSQDWGPSQVIVWDILTEEKRSLAEFRLWAYSNVAFSPDGQWLAAGLAGDERVVAIWQTQTWPEAARLDVEGGIIDQLEFSSDGRLLAGLESFDERSRRIWVWQVPTWRLVSKIYLPDVSLHLAPSPTCSGPCSRWLTFGLKHGTEQPPTYEGQLWDVVSGILVARMSPTDQNPTPVFSHNGRRIATGGEVVKVWELAGEK
jgi:WD40 repeat protein